ncbi:MAG: hypothetical protein V2A73_00775 [Pseudomonadota bacterium]
MTKLLEKAFDEAARLTGEEQDALGQWILVEIASERQWRQTLADSQDQLSVLADEALRDRREGRTEELDPSRL